MPTPTRRMLRPSNYLGLVTDGQSKDESDASVEIDDRVGPEIRALRKARDLTLAVLSKETGLSQGHLSQIERGLSSPSIKALHQISRALGVTISWFFTPGNSDETDLRDTVVRAQNRRSLHFSSGITDELLSPNLDRQIELLRCTFRPGSESGSEPYTHRGEEAGVVLSGELHLWLEDNHIVLRTGDSFAFESKTPHRYANLSDEDTVVIWSITPPTY